MNQPASATSALIKYPPGFRLRRGLNWVILGLMYAAYYTCRYNFRWAAPGMEKEFGAPMVSSCTIYRPIKSFDLGAWLCFALIISG